MLKNIPDYSLGHFRRKRIVKVLSILLLHAFLFSNIGFATEEVPRDKISIENIGISKDIGTIKSRYNGKDGKLVVHIQDAHCNYEAQQNIARILEYLIKHYNINFVAVEGADGIVDTGWFRAFPDAEIRREVADYFMKKGEITGAEFLSITSDYPFTIYGAEDRKYYIKNLNSFLESYPYKDEFQRYYTNVKTALHRLKRFIYTKELASLDRKINEHKKKEIKFADYVRYLKKVAESKKIDIKKYENLKILVETLRHEKDIDFDIVNEERAKLIDELSKKMSKDKLSELVNKSIAFKLGKIEGNEFYSYLAKLTKKNNISLSEKYNNLARYIIYSRIYGKIDNEKLFEEIDLLVKALKEKMFTNDDQRELDRLWTNVNVILGFMNIELTNKEYEYYLANKKEFAPDKFTDFISRNSSHFGLAYDIDEAPSELTYIFPKLVDFYEIAAKRDEIIIKNMFKGMCGKKTDAAILITGGFHTKGISKLLEKKDVSYVVISPTITKEAESPYISVLTGQKTPFEELLIETEKTELQVADKICGTCMDKRITDGRVNEAGERFYTEIATTLIKSYIALFPDTPKDNLKELLINNFKDASKRCPNRIGSRYILEAIERNFDKIAESLELPTQFPPDRYEWTPGKEGREIRDKINHSIFFMRIGDKWEAPSGGVPSVESLIETAKNKYAAIHGNKKASVGYKLSIRRLGTEEQILAIINEVKPDMQKQVALAMVFGKGDIFRFWNDMNPEQKEHLLKQLKTIDIENCQKYFKRLLIDGKEGVPVDVAKVDAPAEVKDTRIVGDDEYLRAREIGKEAFGRGEIAFLELAGGKGSRLGFDQPKVLLSVSQVQDKILVRLRAENIRALSEKYGKPIPWLIMTSDDTHSDIEKFFKDRIKTVAGKECYFGQLPVEWVKFFKQTSVPLITHKGEYLLTTTNEEEYLETGKIDKYEIIMGGFGHGDARDMVLKDKKVQKWLKGFGVEYVCMLNCDNVFIPEEACFGWHIMSEVGVKPGEEHMSTVVVEKKNPAEEVGMAVLVGKKQNRGILEYNQVPPKFIYLMYTYVIDNERFVIFKNDKGNIRLRPVGDGSDDDIALFFKDHYEEKRIGGELGKGLEINGKFLYQGKFNAWIEDHLLTVNDISKGYKFPMWKGMRYTGDTLQRNAHLWLRLGNINQLIWSLKSFTDGKLSKLPVVVAKDKNVSGFIPKSSEYHKKADETLKGQKFETMAFHGFVGNRVKGAYIIVDRIGGFAPIKNPVEKGVATVETAREIYDKYDKELLRSEKNWQMSDTALVELSPMFRNSLGDNIAENCSIEEGARVYLSGKDTSIHERFSVKKKVLVRLRVNSEHLSHTRIRIGKNVKVRKDLTITLEGNGEIIIDDNTVINKPVDKVVKNGQHLHMKKDGSYKVRSFDIPLPAKFPADKYKWARGKKGIEIEDKTNPSIYFVQFPDGSWQMPSGGVPVENKIKVKWYEDAKALSVTLPDGSATRFTNALRLADSIMGLKGKFFLDDFGVQRRNMKAIGLPDANGVIRPVPFNAKGRAQIAKALNMGYEAFLEKTSEPASKQKEEKEEKIEEIPMPRISHSETKIKPHDELLSKVITMISTLRNKTGEWAGERFKDKGTTMLGWTDLSSSKWLENFAMLSEIVKFGKQIRESDTTDVVFIGQGGSIECIKTLRAILWEKPGTPRIHILDTVDNDVINELKETLPLETTRFVAISKSMTTMETISLYKIFFDMYYDKNEAIKHFTFISDEGKTFETNPEVSERGAENIFYIKKDVGGRYSWDTSIGILAASIMDHNIEEMLRGAAEIEEASLHNTDLDKNPAAQYALFKYLMQLEGRNRAVLILPEKLRGYGPWYGQLDVESLGKEADKNSLVVDHPVLTADMSRGTDKRFFVRIKMGPDDIQYQYDNLVKDLESNGYPIFTITLPSGISRERAIAQLLKLSEFATAYTGYLLNINPVNQPGVEAYKKMQKRYLAEGETPPTTNFIEEENLIVDYSASMGEGKISAEELNAILEPLKIFGEKDAAATTAALLYLAAREKRRDYAVMMVFKRLTDSLKEMQNEWRVGVTNTLGIDTLAEEAPCILHAKQQGFQQGENSGFFTIARFLNYENPVTIPGTEHTFAELINAEARGTLEALSSAGRLGVLVSVKDSSEESLADLERFMRLTIVNLHRLANVGTLRKIQKAEKIAPKPGEPLEQTEKSKREFLGVVEGSVVEKYTLEMGYTLMSEPLTLGSAHTLFVKEGEITLFGRLTQFDSRPKKIGKVRREGEVFKIEHKDYEIYAESNATVYLIYTPQEAEASVISGFEAISAPTTLERFGEIAEEERKPIMLHVPETMHANNSFIMEKKILRSASGGTVHMAQYGREIDSLKEEGLDPAYRHVFIAYRDDLERIQQDKELADGLRHVLTQRIMPVARPKDETMGVAFAREIESAAVTLGLTDKEEIEQGLGNATTLQRIMSQLVGEEITLDLLKSLLDVASYDFNQITDRISILINKLLISKPINRYDMDSKIRARRELLWSL